jgi:hypothetical protein
MRNVVFCYTSRNQYHYNSEYDRRHSLPQELSSRANVIRALC